MEGVKRKKDGFIAWTYKWVTGEETLPDGLCRVFWINILGWGLMIIFAPIFLFSLLSRDVRKNPSTYHCGISVVLAMLVMIVVTIAKELWVHSWMEILMGLGVIVALVLFSGLLGTICIGLGRFVLWIKDGIRDRKMDKMTDDERAQYWKDKAAKRDDKKEYKKSFIRIGFESFVKRNCPKMSWV